MVPYMWHTRSQTRESWIRDRSHEAMASVSEVSAIEDSDEESAEERRRRLARKRKVRQRAACSTNRIVTDIASDDRLNKQRRRMANSRAAESPAQRSTRLQALQLRAGQRRLWGTEEQRYQTTIERVSTPHNLPLALTERRGCVIPVSGHTTDYGTKRMSKGGPSLPYSTYMYYTPMGDVLYSITEEGGGRTIRSFMRSNVV